MYKQSKKLVKIEFFLIAECLGVALVVWGVSVDIGFKNTIEFVESMIRDTRYIDFSLVFILIVMFFSVGKTVIEQFKSIGSFESNEIGMIFVILAVFIVGIVNMYVNLFPLRFSIDVSFISLKLVFPVASKLLGEEGSLVCLVKPQFEAGREQVGKKGIVRDKKVHRQVIENVIQYAEENGLYTAGLTYSPVTGAKGNIEYLAWLHWDADKQPDEPIKSQIETHQENE